MTTKTRRRLALRETSVGSVILFACVAVMLASAACADAGTEWFAPTTLTAVNHSPAGSDGTSFEVVLGVTQLTTGGFAYDYWVTNNGSTRMSNFIYTCFGVDELSKFGDFKTYTGTRNTEDGATDPFTDVKPTSEWGQTIDGQPVSFIPRAVRHSYVPEGTETIVFDGCEFTWDALTDGLGSGESIGFHFTSPYGPSTEAMDNAGIRSVLGVRMYSGDVFVSGPTESNTSDVPAVPEWSSVLLALPGLGCVRLLGIGRRRNRC